MRKTLVLFALLLCAIFTGCSAGAGTGSDAVGSATGEAVPAAGSRLTSADLAFSADGRSFELRSDAAALLAALGDGYGATEAVSCLYEGFDKSFIYGDLGVEIYTHPEGEADIIDEILVRSGDFTTARGITVGAALADVRAAYGEGKLEAATLTYVLGDDPGDLAQPRVYFMLTDDKVTSFSLYYPSNISED